MVTSNNCPDEWIVPAGGVEAGEEFEDAAVREVLEEVSDYHSNCTPTPPPPLPPQLEVCFSLDVVKAIENKNSMTTAWNSGMDLGGG